MWKNGEGVPEPFDGGSMLTKSGLLTSPTDTRQRPIIYVKSVQGIGNPEQK